MVTQSEGDKEFGKGDVAASVVRSAPESGAGSDLETPLLPDQYFGPDDAQRADRIASLDGEADTLLSSVGLRVVRPEGLDDGQLRSLQGYAEQRARWNQATSDVFTGLLRLGNKPPARSRRVL